eukprot:6209065-Pleurochrysis_carterae.AAC.9
MSGSHEEKPKVRKAEKPQGGATLGKESKEGVAFWRNARELERAENLSSQGKTRAGGLKRGWGWVRLRERGGARRRQRRVRERRSYGDGECASFWQTS